MAQEQKPENTLSPKSTETAGASTNKTRQSIFMLGLAFLVGIIGGFGAVLFKIIIAFVHNFLFYGRVNLNFDPNTHTAVSSWGAWVILVPVIASFAVTWITKTLAPEARGHGVPEVLEAIYHRHGKIRPIIVIAKAVASAISIGSGGSVGREGPIVQIGSAFGSVLGQVIRMPDRQRITLIAAGAAAGIAATFNAPIGGVAFAVELLLVSVSARTIALVAVSTVTATYIGRYFGGMAPSFDVPAQAMFGTHELAIWAILLCVPLGVTCGLVAALFIHSIYFAEDKFEELIHNDYIRHAVGMLAVGVAFYLFMLKTGHYFIDGVGYATVMDVLRGTLGDPWILGLLFVGKLLATDLTLGSGASGGVFSPSLFLGATIGALFGNLVNSFFPSLDISPALFTIAAMAGVVGSATGAVVTAIVMTFEQTRNYSVILPIILTVAMAYIVRMGLCSDSIYTLKLARRGAFVPQGLQAATPIRSPAKKVMSTDFHLIDLAAFKAERNSSRGNHNNPRYTIVLNEGDVYGVVRDRLWYLLDEQDIENVIDRNFMPVSGTSRWTTLLRGLHDRKAETALVFQKAGQTKGEDLLGVITAREIMDRASSDAELMLD